MRSPHASIRQGRSSASGDTASSETASRGLTKSHAAGGQPAFPSSVVVAIKRMACEAPATAGLPLARWSIRELQREAVARGLVATIGGATLWRWLDTDALRPWRHRSWLFPRDPEFAAKAGPILDRYAGRWRGTPLNGHDCVLSADEKTSMVHRSLPTQPHRSARIEHEYERMGAWAYLAAWDLRRATVFGRCERKNGIASFDRLVADVMAQRPYRTARRVFWIMDNGSAHRGAKAVERLQRRWPTIVPVFTPTHASWLNPIEIYFSIVQRKVLNPNDFATLRELEATLLAFQTRYTLSAKPFQWTFTRRDLTALLNRMRCADDRVAA
jgi:transposase